MRSNGGQGEEMNQEIENQVPMVEQIEGEQDYALTEDGTVVKAEDLPEFTEES